MADNVIIYREENGPFTSRAQIKKVKGIGPKAYEQAVGFLRIIGAKEPLDSTGIHPETYKVTYELLEKEFGVKKKKVNLPMDVDLTKPLVDLSQVYEIGEETLEDIFRELQNPGLDPREDLDETSFKSDVLTIDDLKEGTEVTGVVRNIVDFGAFVDIGVKK